VAILRYAAATSLKAVRRERACSGPIRLRPGVGRPGSTRPAAGDPSLRGVTMAWRHADEYVDFRQVVTLTDRSVPLRDPGLVPGSAWPRTSSLDAQALSIAAPWTPEQVRGDDVRGEINWSEVEVVQSAKPVNRTSHLPAAVAGASCVPTSHPVMPAHAPDTGVQAACAVPSTGSTGA